MRNVFCQSLVGAVAPARVRLPDRRPGLHGAGAAARRAWASGSSTPAWPSRTWSRSPPGWPRRPAALGLQHRAVRLRPALRADPQRRLPARAAGGAGRQRRRLRLRRDGGHPPRARGLRRAALPARTCAPTCRRSTSDVARRWSTSSSTAAHPAYLRLGLSEEPTGVDAARLRALAAARSTGGAGWSLVTGPLVGGIWDAVRQLDEPRPAGALGALASCPLGDDPRRRSSPTCARSRPAARGRGARRAGRRRPDARRRLLAAGRRRRAVRHRGGAGLRLRAVRLAEVPPRASAASTPPSIVEFLTAERRLTMPDDAARRDRDRRSPRRSAASRARSSSSGPAASSAPTCCASLLAVREDVYGTTTRTPGLAARGPARRATSGSVDLLVDSNLDALLDEVRPADRLQLRRLRRLLVRDRQPADLPDQLQLHSPGCSTRLRGAVDRLLRPRRQLVGVRRQRRRARARTTLPRPTATTPSRRSPRPT